MESIYTPLPDPEYSFEIVVFEVGDRTFRVPRHGFDIPGNRFPLSLPEAESTPHVLDVDEGHFRALLRAMYPFVGCQSPTTNDWLIALDLATQWKLVEVRNRAISTLDSWVENQPAKKVVLLAKKYSILNWLKGAYLRLVQQEVLTTQELLSPPTLDWETIGRLLDANRTASINAVYKDIQRCCSLCSSATCDCQGVVLRSNVEYEFKEEFETIGRDWPQMANNLSLEDATEADGSTGDQRLASNSDPDEHTAGNTGRDARDKEYYFELVVFKVGNTTFRVPKNGLVVPGTIFEAMFSLPTMEEHAEGLNDQNPINLPVNEENFRGFLRAMYPFNGVQLGDTDWLGALDLSTMWMFDELRNRAIQALEPWIQGQSAKEVVLLAKKYRILKWLKAGYTRLLQQPSLTAAELSATPSLDWETIAKLLSAKLLTSNQLQHHYHYSVVHPEQNLLSAMEQEFREEFSGMD